MTSCLRPSHGRLLAPLVLLGALGGCAVTPLPPAYPGDVVVVPPPVTGQVWLYGGSGGVHPGYRHAPPPPRWVAPPPPRWVAPPPRWSAPAPSAPPQWHGPSPGHDRRQHGWRPGRGDDGPDRGPGGRGPGEGRGRGGDGR
jgi:hypothetical protein